MEEASHQDRTLTRAVEAIENSGMRELAGRQDFETVEILEDLLLDRKMSLQNLEHIVLLYEKEPTQDDEKRLEFQEFWEQTVTHLEGLDQSMDALVAKLDTTSQDYKLFRRDQTERQTSYGVLTSRFHRAMATPASPAAGSAPLLPRRSRPQGSKNLPTAPRA